MLLTAFLYLSQQQVWSRTRTDLGAKSLDAELENSREQMREIYKDLINEHIKECARITGMIQVAGIGTVIPVEDKDSVARSLLANPDDANIKRACFIIYHSNLAYKYLYSMPMPEYHEKTVMDAMNITYDMSEKDSGHGCVAKYGRGIWNQAKDTMKRTAKKMVEFQESVQPNIHKGRRANCIFTISRPEGTTEVWYFINCWNESLIHRLRVGKSNFFYFK